MGIGSVMRVEGLQPFMIPFSFSFIGLSLPLFHTVHQWDLWSVTNIHLSIPRQGKRETVRRTRWLDYLLENYRSWALPFTVERCYVASGHSSTPNLDQHRHQTLFINTTVLGKYKT